MRVTRYSTPLQPDRLELIGEHGEVVLDVAMGPGELLHPRSADEARSRPWFFTGSPFGPAIYGLAWERHRERQREAGDAR